MYFDDFLVYSKPRQQHIEYLRKLSCLLREATVFANLNTCAFLHPHVLLLGFIMSTQGIYVDPDSESP